MKQYLAEIVANQKVCKSMYRMDLFLDGFKSIPLPGQFFTVRITDSFTPLLRRPFAFSGFDPSGQRGSCVYQVRGDGTRLLSSFGKSANLDVIAPLGRPFFLPEAPNRKPVLVAGGIGLGPLLFLADMLKKKGIGYEFIFGCRSAEFFPAELFGKTEVVLCTDDGSAGFHGSVMECIAAKGFQKDRTVVLYCCGPQPMLRACHEFALRYDLECYVSVEQVMACGVGACMGCAVEVNGPDRFVRACKEGPVFRSKDIVWER